MDFGEHRTPRGVAGFDALVQSGGSGPGAGHPVAVAIGEGYYAACLMNLPGSGHSRASQRLKEPV